jgi:hypothetical protein
VHAAAPSRYPLRMRRLALVVAALAVASGTAALAAPRTPTSYAFGRSGGNIAPFTVSIAADGTVTVNGPVRTTRKRVSATGMAHLASVLRRAHFSRLPATTRCTGTLPDFAAFFVTVRVGSSQRTVLVHGDCSRRFTTVLKALDRAVGLRYGTG